MRKGSRINEKVAANFVLASHSALHCVHCREGLQAWASQMFTHKRVRALQTFTKCDL